MCSYDDDIVNNIHCKFGNEAASNVQYIVDGSIDDISMSANAKLGFTTFALVTILNQRQVSLFNGVMSFKFSLTSGKIKDVEFWLKSGGDLSILPTLSLPNTSVGKVFVSSNTGSEDVKSDVTVDDGDGPGMSIWS